MCIYNPSEALTIFILELYTGCFKNSNTYIELYSKKMCLSEKCVFWRPGEDSKNLGNNVDNDSKQVENLQRQVN